MNLKNITINGFKSIASLTQLELKRLNLLLGANGTGKSNFIDALQLLRAHACNHLDTYIHAHGGINDCLFHGTPNAEKIFIEVNFDKSYCRLNLKPTAQNNFVVEKNNDASHQTILNDIASWKIYHFNGDIRFHWNRTIVTQERIVLSEDASNIGQFLWHLKNNHASNYNQIVHGIRLVVPTFDDFVFVSHNEKDTLRWKQKATHNSLPITYLSNGSQRFIALASALLQPYLPTLVAFDTPELYLDPTTLALLAELIQAASVHTQIVVATQSSALIDEFNIDDIIAVKLNNGQSNFERLQSKHFNVWLENYSVGELWIKNVLTAHAPVH